MTFDNFYEMIDLIEKLKHFTQDKNKIEEFFKFKENSIKFIERNAFLEISHLKKNELTTNIYFKNILTIKNLKISALKKSFNLAIIHYEDVLNNSEIFYVFFLKSNTLLDMFKRKCGENVIFLEEGTNITDENFIFSEYESKINSIKKNERKEKYGIIKKNNKSENSLQKETTLKEVKKFNYLFI